MNNNSCTCKRGTAKREMGYGLNFAYITGGRWEMVGVIGRREAGGGRAPRNPKGDGRFCKNWSVSQWEKGDLSKIYLSKMGGTDGRFSPHVNKLFAMDNCTGII